MDITLLKLSKINDIIIKQLILKQLKLTKLIN